MKKQKYYSLQIKINRALAIAMLSLLLYALGFGLWEKYATAQEPLLWPVPMHTPTPTSLIEKNNLLPHSLPSSLDEEGLVGVIVAPTSTPKNDMQMSDLLVGQYVDLFMSAASNSQRSEARSIMHCLLTIESVHNSNKGMGDNGLAGGPLQFHQQTYVRMRNWMMSEGFADDLGSRMDLEDSIETAIWILWQSRLPSKMRQGSIGEWGPIYRPLRGIAKQSCKIPSWYNYK